jgi:hypothetical protein
MALAQFDYWKMHLLDQGMQEAHNSAMLMRKVLDLQEPRRSF